MFFKLFTHQKILVSIFSIGISFYTNSQTNIEGCTDSLALNFNVEINEDNSNCFYSSQVIQDLLSDYYDAFDTWNNISISLNSGWNMFGYICPNIKPLEDILINYIDEIIIVKNNEGDVFLPEWSFNGIGDFTPGHGYLIKVVNDIEHFSLCNQYVNQLLNDNMIDLQTQINQMDSFFGCTFIDACNYDALSIVDDSSCLYPDLYYDCEGQCNNDFDQDGECDEVDIDDEINLDETSGCTDSLACNYNALAQSDNSNCVYPEVGYDCNGIITEPYIGMQAYGGIIFYIDQSGQHGLVITIDDINVNIGYQWGCYGDTVNGADGLELNSGNQNTLDIISQNCESEDELYPITAAIACYHYIYYGNDGVYIDWYLPSLYELSAAYSNIGQEMINSYINNFSTGIYWSSTEYNNTDSLAWGINFGDGNASGSALYTLKHNKNYVRPIRSF